ncbi:MAG: hypothetical protein WDA41_10540 [Candidatus Neomarinimicrobiota bacterium]
MPEDVISQVILQAPTIAALLYLLFRLDARLDELIKTICELATEVHDDREAAFRRTLDNT